MEQGTLLKTSQKRKEKRLLQGGFGSGKTRLCYSIKHTLESMGPKVIVYTRDTTVR